jgi:pimeloyl-ACP methyl ester carboxylesterase
MKARTLMALLGLWSVSAQAAGIAMLIPGSGSSGDKIYLKGLDWAAQALGGDHYFTTIQADLIAEGIPAFVCPITPDQDERTLEERAEECVQQIQGLVGTECSDRSVHLLGHSMGGLIARLLAQDDRVKDCIRTVTLVSTPNRGTPLADWAIDHAANDDRSFDLLGKIVKLVDFVPSVLHYLPELRVDRSGYPASVFAAQDAVDNPEVKYYSATTSMKFIPILPLEATHLIIAAEIKRRGLDQTPYGTRNDGIVPEFSMPHGEDLGHLDANHWEGACVDPVKRLPGCHRVEKLLVAHFKSITAR